MDIHKPKPAHNWREFLTELGTIICGILIALGLEQAVEWSHGQERLAQARDQLKKEVDGNISAAALWLSAAPCLDARLTQIEQALWSARQSGAYPGAPPFTPPLARFQSESWLNARALQVFDRLSAGEVRDLASFYFYPAEMTTSVTTLHSQGGELELLSHPLPHMTPAEADDLLARLGRAKELFVRMNYASMLIIQEGRALGGGPPHPYSAAEVAQWSDQPAACASTPGRVWTTLKTTPIGPAAWTALGLQHRIR